MTWSRRIALLACVLPIAVASGCTGTDVLSTGNADFVEDVLDVEISHAVEDEPKRALFAVIDQQHQGMVEERAAHGWCCDEKPRCE